MPQYPFQSPYDRMNKQQREEARELFGALFGEPQQQEPPSVTYDPNSGDKQNFMAGLLLPEGPEREKFEAHQRRLQQGQIDRDVDAGVISPDSPAGQESLRRRAQAQNTQEEYLRQRHIESMRLMGLYR